jgi:hypothetical protein
MQTLRFIVDITSTTDRFFVEEWVLDCIARNVEVNEEFEMRVESVPLNEGHVQAITNRMVELAKADTRYSEVA